MNRIFYILIGCLLSSLTYGQEPLNSTVNYTLTTSGGKPAYMTEADLSKGIMYTENGVELSHTRQSYGGFMINDLVVDLNKGAEFEFEYSFTIGEKGYSFGAGFTFFLYDAASEFKVGYQDSALGYAYNDNLAATRRDGLKGAYLGIALDGTGRFYMGAAQISKIYEYREGISVERFLEAGYTEKDVFHGVYGNNHLTLRGALNSVPGRDYIGTAVLVTKSYPGSNSNPELLSMGTLNYETGEYSFGRVSNSADFSIGKYAQTENVVFQRIKIQMNPVLDKDSNQAMLINIQGVDINENVVPLLEDFVYQQSYKTYNEKGKLYQGSAVIPKAVRIGFYGSATLSNPGKIIVRNLKVTSGSGFDLPEVSKEVCLSDVGNSKGAVAQVTPFDKDKEKINVSSFNFLDALGNPIGMMYEQDYVGTWKYDPLENLVTLVVSGSNVSPQTKLQIKYTVENTSGEKSNASSIEFQGVGCGAPINSNVLLPEKK